MVCQDQSIYKIQAQKTDMQSESWNDTEIG